MINLFWWKKYQSIHSSLIYSQPTTGFSCWSCQNSFEIKHHPYHMRSSLLLTLLKAIWLHFMQNSQCPCHLGNNCTRHYHSIIMLVTPTWRQALDISKTEIDRCKRNLRSFISKRSIFQAPTKSFTNRQKCTEFLRQGEIQLNHADSSRSKTLYPHFLFSTF